ncbi:hypothetical protein ACJZ2D_008104 [Fusarium nematophilum]
MSSSQNPDKQTTSAPDTDLKIWSCVICRRRKVRCDRKDPCSNCVKSNIECHFPVTGRIPRRSRDPNAWKSPAQKQSELLGRLRRLESVVTELAAQVEDGPSGPTMASEEGSTSGGETGQTPATSADASVIGSSQVASSTGHQAGVEFDEEFGRLVVDKGGGLHVGNRFWSVFCDEVDNILQAVHDVAEYSSSPSGSAMPEVGLEGGPSPLSHLGFVFGNADFARALDGLNPMPSQMLFIWQTYVENVDPFIKVFHVPTVEKVIRESRGNFSAYGSKMEALLFAISLAAITSMDEEAVMLNFNTPRSQLLQRYQFGTEQALARADFLAARDMVVLQALVIHLSVLPHLGAKERVWPMMGLVLRLAKSAGLHRDGDAPGQNGLEREMRRRLWWQICFLDSATRRNEAPELSITQDSFDTKMPSNADDSDLGPGALAHPPREDVTDTTLCLIRCHLWHLTQALRTGSAKTPEARLQIFHAAKARVETMYLRFLQLDKPWHSFVKAMTTLFLAKVELLIRRRPNGAIGSEETADASLQAAMETIKACRSLKTEPRWSKWRWQLRGHVPWHAMGVFLREAARREWAPQFEEAWDATEALIEGASEDAKRGPLWEGLMELMSSAQAQRDKGERRRTGGHIGDTGPAGAIAGIPSVNQLGQLNIGAPMAEAGINTYSAGPGSLDPTSLLMESSDPRLHLISVNPPSWGLDENAAAVNTGLEFGCASLLDEVVPMDWETLVDFEGTWSTWDFF